AGQDFGWDRGAIRQRRWSNPDEGVVVQFRGDDVVLARFPLAGPGGLIHHGASSEGSARSVVGGEGAAGLCKTIQGGVVHGDGQVGADTGGGHLKPRIQRLGGQPYEGGGAALGEGTLVVFGLAAH